METRIFPVTSPGPSGGIDFNVRELDTADGKRVIECAACGTWSFSRADLSWECFRCSGVVMATFTRQVLVKGFRNPLTVSRQAPVRVTRAPGGGGKLLPADVVGCRGKELRGEASFLNPERNAIQLIRSEP